MNIIVRGGVALSVLRDDLDYPYIGNLRPDMICEDLSVIHADPNTRDIFLLREWGRYNVMTIEDIEEELQEFTDKMYRRKMKVNKGRGDIRIKRILQDREHIQKGELIIKEVR
jgi:hypothetical protein